MLNKFNDIQERARRLFAFSIMYFFSLFSPGSIKYKYKKILVSWFARLKSRLFNPFRDLRANIEDRIVKFVDGRKARKQAHEDVMFAYLKRAAEDCVAIHGDRQLAMDVVRFDATREISKLLKSTLHEYLRTHKYPSIYGDILAEALRKGLSPNEVEMPQGWSISIPDKGVEYDLERIPRSEERRLKTINNQIMWNYKKHSGGRTPREVAINILTRKIEYAEKIVSGEVKKDDTGGFLAAKEKSFIDKIKEHKARLEKLKNSNDFYAEVEDINF